MAITLTITDDMIEAGKSRHGGFTRAALDVLGVPWPPKRGWKKLLIGKPIQKTDYQKYLEAGGGSGESRLPNRETDRWWGGFVREMEKIKPCFVAEFEPGLATAYCKTTGKSFGVLSRAKLDFLFNCGYKVSTKKGYGMVLKRLREEQADSQCPFGGNIALKAKVAAGLAEMTEKETKK